MTKQEHEELKEVSEDIKNLSKKLDFLLFLQAKCFGAVDLDLSKADRAKLRTITESLEEGCEWTVS